jgi:hypothetical protein
VIDVMGNFFTFRLDEMSWLVIRTGMSSPPVSTPKLKTSNYLESMVVLFAVDAVYSPVTMWTAKRKEQRGKGKGQGARSREHGAREQRDKSKGREQGAQCKAERRKLKAEILIFLIFAFYFLNFHANFGLRI